MESRGQSKRESSIKVKTTRATYACHKKNLTLQDNKGFKREKFLT
jgi:hypothetical protein